MDGGARMEIIKEIPIGWDPGYDFEQHHHMLWQPLFSVEDCDRIIDLGEAGEKIKGTITDKHAVDPQIRNSSISWIHHNKDSDWLYYWIWTSALNTNFWGLDVVGFYDSLQYTVYDANDGEAHYGWHTDTGPDMNHRKLSLSIQLSDPDEYSGGIFELERGGLLNTPEHLRKGNAIMFPSILRHRVLPVTKGVRKSLVVWLAGPHIR